MKTKSDPKNAREPRVVETRSNYQLAEKLAKKFLTLTCRHRFPGQREMLIGYMLVAHGFELAYPVEPVNPLRAFSDLELLERRLVEFAKLAKAKEWAKERAKASAKERAKGGGSGEF
jgi:hypothetical protein